MKPDMRRSVFARFHARFGLRFFGIALCAAGALALGTAGVCQPQPQSQHPQSAPAAGGMHEGLQVHGHWVIEVRNPDGKVTARREFENSIQSAGATFLSALIAGNNSSGGLSVLLNGASTNYTEVTGLGGATLLTFSEAGPCAPLSGVSVTVSGTVSGGTTCLITTGANAKGNESFWSGICLGAQATENGSGVVVPPNGQTYPCSTNLAVTAPTISSGSIGSAGIELQGSVTVTAASSGDVNDVETVFATCDTNSTPGNCLTLFSVQSVSENSNVNSFEYNVFTERNLDGQNGDPPAVPYGPGQIINVTVTISFQ